MVDSLEQQKRIEIQSNYTTIFFITVYKLNSSLKSMVTIETFKKLALSLPDVVEQPHFDKDSYRVNKKIFATLSVESNLVCVMLSVIDQSVFCAYDKSIMYPVNNKWGKQGCTMIDLKKIRKSMLKDALTTAYNKVSKPKRTAEK